MTKINITHDERGWQAWSTENGLTVGWGRSRAEAVGEYFLAHPGYEFTGPEFDDEAWDIDAYEEGYRDGLLDANTINDLAQESAA